MITQDSNQILYGDVPISILRQASLAAPAKISLRQFFKILFLHTILRLVPSPRSGYETSNSGYNIHLAQNEPVLVIYNI